MNLTSLETGGPRSTLPKEDCASLIFRAPKREISDTESYYDFKAQDLGSVASVPLRANASWLSSALLQEHELAIQLQPFFECD